MISSFQDISVSFFFFKLLITVLITNLIIKFVTGVNRGKWMKEKGFYFM